MPLLSSPKQTEASFKSLCQAVPRICSSWDHQQPREKCQNHRPLAQSLLHLSFLCHQSIAWTGPSVTTLLPSFYTPNFSAPDSDPSFLQSPNLLLSLVLSNEYHLCTGLWSTGYFLLQRQEDRWGSLCGIPKQLPDHCTSSLWKITS